MTLSIDKKTPSLYLGAYAKDSNDMVGNIIPTAPDNPSKVSVQQKGKHAFPSKQQLDMIAINTLSKGVVRGKGVMYSSKANQYLCLVVVLKIIISLFRRGSSCDQFPYVLPKNKATKARWHNPSRSCIGLSEEKRLVLLVSEFRSFNVISQRTSCNCNKMQS